MNQQNDQTETNMEKARPVVIVGGGISGLATAYYLSQRGIRPTLIEQAARLGGLVHTETIAGNRVENGPDSFLLNKTAAIELIREIGLEGELIPRNEALHATYIWKQGRLQALPEGLSMMIPTRVMPMVRTGLLGWGTKLRMGLDWFRSKAPNAGEVSVAEFVRSHYGQETVDYLAEPLLAGVYGGDCEKMSATEVLGRFVEIERQYGSLTRGVLRERNKGPGAKVEFRSLKGGMGQITERLAQLLRDKCDFLTGGVQSLERTAEGWRIGLEGTTIEAHEVVLACTALTAGRLLHSADLASIEHTSAATVMFGFPRDQVQHPLNGFGFLVPKPERNLMLAATWVNTKFNHRAAADTVLIRCFTGEAGMKLDDAALIAAMLGELKEKMGLVAEPAFTRINRWPNSMPQYHVGHRALVKRIEAALPAGVHLVGNAYSGVGVPDCIRLAKQVAAKIG
jgi:oxygen-dependent protoporphyrinogen oxidase